MTDTYKLVPANKQNTSTWSGGTTTELAIYPPGANYSKRDFAWRLSTAVVTAPESTFTALPDWHRVLMVLSGQMHLNHSGHHQVTLSPFEQDSFSGSWLTKCAGTGQDYNLMLAEGWQGRLQALHLETSGSILLRSLPNSTEAFYCLCGGAQVSLPGTNELLVISGDFLLVKPNQLSRCTEIRAIQPTRLIRASIWQRTNQVTYYQKC